MRRHFAAGGLLPGALNGLMAELIEGHVRFHVLSPAQKSLPSQLEAADELISVVKRYFK